MKLKIQTPVELFRTSKAKFTPLAADVEKFARHLTEYRSHINTSEREEHFKQPLRTLLAVFFDPKDHYINTQYNQDSAIYFGSTADSRIAVMFETKKPASSDMIRTDRLNVKALWELVLYYFEEKIIRGNFELKHLIATDYLDFFVFDANTFDRHFFRNNEIKRLYEMKVNDGKPNTDFYPTLQSLIDRFPDEIPCVHFNLDKPDKLNKTERTAIFKMLSPPVLLKQRPATDSNALNKPFYDELLHIIGLTEKKDGKKIKIVRLDEAERQPGSLLELTISKLRVEYPCNLTETELAHYGTEQDEHVFQIAFELCLTWMNRILFLKLLESQLVRFHPNEKGYAFLNIEQIDTFDKLYDLFHHVLAVEFDNREETYSRTFERIPYLNSSLFELAEIERKTLTANALGNDIDLPYADRTVLKERHKAHDKLATLPYLFAFLDSFDYTSITCDQLEISDKRLINASILGKIFEKINGYREGSIYTPGFITMYMCREAIRPAVVEKFNELKGWNIRSFEGLQDKLGSHNEPVDKLEFNCVIDQIRICDPAVGSGHFLVSSLNELIVIKHELGILCDQQGRTFRNFRIVIEDDELLITDGDNEPFQYQIVGGRPPAEVQRFQQTLFHQKQNIIEKCLFGVDINPNSVAICRLRLWIELLKHAYYKADADFTELETLPNIDINIKRGNSLLSEYPLELTFTSPSTRQWLREYSFAVNKYKNETDKVNKEKLIRIIGDFREKFASQLPDETSDLRVKHAKQQRIKYDNEHMQLSIRTLEERGRRIVRAEGAMRKIEEEINAIKRKYDDAFEWRFEFPEVLDDEGSFKGFDVVIANPPYIRGEIIGSFKKHLLNKYAVYAPVADIATFPAIIRIKNQPRSNEPHFTQVKTLKFASLADVVSQSSFQLTPAAFTGPTWTLAKANVIDLLRKIEMDTVPLAKIVGSEPERGIITGLTEAFIIGAEQRQRFLDVNPECDEIIVPFATGNDIRKYHVEYKNTYLLLVKIDTKIDRYPAVFAHLSQFQEKLEKRVDKGNYWWELRPCAYYDDFTRPRIIYPDIAKASRMAYVEKPLYVANTAYIIPTENKYLAGLLNSSLIFFYYSQISSVLGDAQEGGRLRWFTQYVSQLPVRQGNPTIEEKVRRLVSEIIEMKDRGENTSEQESEIDTIIYDLYELDTDERRFIDGYFQPQALA